MLGCDVKIRCCPTPCAFHTDSPHANTPWHTWQLYFHVTHSCQLQTGMVLPQVYVVCLISEVRGKETVTSSIATHAQVQP
jgi:hypothetical protein